MAAAAWPRDARRHARERLIAGPENRASTSKSFWFFLQKELILPE
jgi:hypothetical protein